MELINNKPIILLDGAHNPMGIKLLVESLKNDFKYDKLFFIIGILKDKNIKSMIPPLISITDYMIVTQVNNDRSLNSLKLERIVYKLNNKINVINKKNIPDAIRYTLSLTNHKDLICITGSLYTIGEAIEFFKKNKKVLTNYQ
jgi:dihydrofolate synthase/folylpolyglutamate synthase